MKKLLALLALIAVPAWAATVTTTFTVSTSVVGTCSISATNLNFGPVPSPINSNIDAQNSVTATCSNLTPYTIALSVGNGPGATFAVRRMTSGVNTLDYSLFTDAARTTVWGDGTGGSTLVNNTGSGGAQVIPVFGRIPSPQTPATGTYTDTILVTLTF